MGYITGFIKIIIPLLYIQSLERNLTLEYEKLEKNYKGVMIHMTD